ncbi:FAD-binding oxidoreductase [Ruania albidiflava]|uniref:FAD-binding oxidoreductase n=1 Tax=Ruania albidiflava TaxID=366586 RepID=UPI000A053FBD|nr:FAD-binding oxidoreductase [Ruania albidiflava]
MINQDQISNDLRNVATIRVADPIIGGIPPLTITPESENDLIDVVKYTRENDMTIMARGSGSALQCGGVPNGLDAMVETTKLSDIVEYHPDDLVVVTKAGISLSALNETLRRDNLELSLDPPRERYENGSTVGGLLATGTAGPRALVRRSVRDLVLGVRAVLPDGRCVQFGGKVVKNVAGYDLSKLFIGAFGTLGIVTEVAFRLHPRAHSSAYVASSTDLGSVAELMEKMGRSQLVASGVEMTRHPRKQDVTLVAGFEGTDRGVERRSATAIDAFDGKLTERPEWWTDLPEAATVFKVSCSLGVLGKVLRLISDMEDELGIGIEVRVSGTGVGYVGVHTADNDLAATLLTKIRGLLSVDRQGVCSILYSSEGLRNIVDPWGEVDGLKYMQELKDRFDPDRRLAPGRFVGGI